MWKVALSGGPLDGQVVEVPALGRLLIARRNLYADGTIGEERYDYTGLVPRLKTAFARYTGEDR